MTEHLKFAVDEFVATITLDRSGRLNACLSRTGSAKRATVSRLSCALQSGRMVVGAKALGIALACFADAVRYAQAGR